MMLLGKTFILKTAQNISFPNAICLHHKIEPFTADVGVRAEFSFAGNANEDILSFIVLQVFLPCLTSAQFGFNKFG